MTEYSKCGLTSANWKGTGTSLKLLAALLLVQLDMCLAFIASRAHCWLMLINFSTPGPALQSCSLPSHSPACSVAGASSEFYEVSASQKEQCTQHEQIHYPFLQRKVFSMCLSSSFTFLTFARSPQTRNWPASHNFGFLTALHHGVSVLYNQLAYEWLVSGRIYLMLHRWGWV